MIKRNTTAKKGVRKDPLAVRLRLLADRLRSVAAEIDDGIDDESYRLRVEALAERLLLAERGYTMDGALTFEIVEDILDAAAQRLRLDGSSADEITAWTRSRLEEQLVLTVAQRMLPKLDDAALGESITRVATRAGKWKAVTTIARRLGVRGDEASLKRHLLRARAKRG